MTRMIKLRPFLNLLACLIIFIALPIVSSAGTEQKNVLKIFFRSDCPPCLQEIKIVPEIAKEHQELHIEIISLDGVLHDPHVPEKFPSNVHLYAAANGEHEMTGFGNRNFALPFSVFISGDGKICRRHYGILGTERVTRWLKLC